MIAVMHNNYVTRVIIICTLTLRSIQCLSCVTMLLSIGWETQGPCRERVPVGIAWFKGHNNIIMADGWKLIILYHSLLSVRNQLASSFSSLIISTRMHFMIRSTMQKYTASFLQAFFMTISIKN